MVCHVVLFCCAALICREPVGADETEPSLADQLNATLSHPGWKRITKVAAKYPFAVDGKQSFTGTDLFVSDNLFFEDETAVVNTWVGDDNATVKHCMVTLLVGCVYANATAKFLNLLKIIFEEVNRVRKNLKADEYRRRMKRLAQSEAQEAAGQTIDFFQIDTFVEAYLDGIDAKSREGPADDEELIDFKVPWEIFNYALHRLSGSSAMFDLMFSTLKYLIDTIPPGEPFGHDPYARTVLEDPVLPCLQLLKNASKDIHALLPEYAGSADPAYNDKVGPFTCDFIGYLEGQVEDVVQPFLDRFCAVSEKEGPTLKTEVNSFRSRYRKKPVSLDIAYQLGEKINLLVDKVCNDYHSLLGFVYDADKDTTSYSIPPTLIDVPSETFLASGDRNLSEQ